MSALPSPAARAAAFVGICVAGAAGGAGDARFVRSFVVLLAATVAASLFVIGAVGVAAGMAVVAVLVLRALGEWRELGDRR